MKKYQAAAYLRLSVAGSCTAESESLENQKYIIDRFVNENDDIELVSSYSDLGHSGLIFDRPAFLNMMEDAKAGKIDCIIVKDLSRFGRDFIETGRYLQRTLPMLGIRFIAILDQVDTLHSPPSDDIVMQIKTIINDEFSREISTRTRSSLKTMRKCGLYVGACPIYGYQKSRECKNQLVPDSGTMPVVQRIFEMKLAGASAAKITVKLNEEGVLSPLAYKRSLGLSQPHYGFSDTEDPKWSTTTVLRILKDETYTGTLVQGKRYKLNYKLQKTVTRSSTEWVRCNNTHKAIISQQDFDTVQRILLLDTRASPGCDIVSLFSGILTCGSCGGNMTRKTVQNGDKSYRYYYCPTGKRKGCIAPAMIAENVLIAAVFSKIQCYIEKARLLSKDIEQMTNKEIGHLFTKDILNFIENTQEQVQQLRAYQSTLCVSLIRGIISAEDKADMEVAYTQEILQLEAAIAEATGQVQAIEAHIDERVMWIAEIVRLTDMTNFERIHVIRLIKRITVLFKTAITIEFVLVL